MMGNDESRGVIPRLNDDLFQSLKEKLDGLKAKGVGESKFMITVSYLEIYNEIIRDLLNPTDKKLLIRESPATGIFVDGLCELVVKDAADVARLLAQGSAVRRVAATNMNEQSSRSHSCFTIKIEQKTTTELAGGVTREQVVSAKLNLVDLAGSERANKTGATGATLKEGANINKSLLVLGNVITALSEGSKRHIPYRDSNLTRLLQESLGGNARTVMLAAVSPADYNYDETLSTLKYANRAKSIENEVSKNEDINEKVIRELKEEVERLKAQLLRDADLGKVDPEQQRRLLEMELSQRNAWEEKERLSRELEEQRSANMNAVISTVIDGVKDQKVRHLKSLKKLNIEKSDLAKQEKSLKDRNAQLKQTLDEDMKRYMALQSEYDTLKKTEKSTEAVSTKMAQLLQKIETDRTKWAERKDAIKKAKERLKELDSEIDLERAELVATAGILEQNDQLREKIQEEEREKARELIEREISEAKRKLESERETVRDSLETQFSLQLSEAENRTKEYMDRLRLSEKERTQLLAKNHDLSRKVDELEDKLAELEAEVDATNRDKESLQREIESLTDQATQMQTNYEAMIQKIKDDAKVRLDFVLSEHQSKVEAEKLRVFRTLMDGFQDEQTEMRARVESMRSLLMDATRDMAYLSRENADLRDKFNRAVNWEPSILPSKAAGAKAPDAAALPPVAGMNGHMNGSRPPPILTNGHTSAQDSASKMQRQDSTKIKSPRRIAPL